MPDHEDAADAPGAASDPAAADAPRPDARGAAGDQAAADAPHVAIAAGGTAGHVVPALAIADALRERGAHVLFLGGERAEAELVPAAGYPFYTLRVAGIDRRNPLKAARAVTLAGRATAAARRILKRERVDVVIGGGGYVAGPAGAAAVALRLPLVLTEADSHLGIANRLLAPRARKVFLAFPLSSRSGPRYEVVGRPVPRATGKVDRVDARQRFGLPADRACLLVFGGSLGARTINVAALDAFGRASPCSVLHACGRRDYDELRARLDALGSPPHYRLEAYVEPFADALAVADIAVARAGGSVFELAAAGIPSVLVPYPHATADHQSGNARWMADGGAAVIVPDAELDGPRLAREVAALLGSAARLEAMSAAARRLARIDAADRVADEVVRLAGRSRSLGRTLA
jgi:UDP-N-acetylglucosamine--N-acetylmuramyl-(pentapeptide) pyrophosphoryl-undecaprenol N-acetylglucosamine transferase